MKQAARFKAPKFLDTRTLVAFALGLACMATVTLVPQYAHNEAAHVGPDLSNHVGPDQLQQSSYLDTPCDSSSSSLAFSTADSSKSSSSLEQDMSDISINMGRQLLYQGGSFNTRWRRSYGSYKSRWHPTVLKSAFKATSMLTSTREERAERIFVPLLSTRHSELCCMLTDLSKKVAGTTPMDVFVFTVENQAEHIFKRSVCWKRKFNMTVLFMALDEHWGVDPKYSSSAFHDRNGYVGLPGLFGDDYRRMGHWRLTFQFAFADVLGYKYLWQLDDDSFFPTAMNFSMIDYMQRNDLWIAGHRTLPDPHFVTWGLAEITRLFLVAERLDPPGTLFSNHTTPRGLEGLFTVFNDTSRGWQNLTEAEQETGWSRTIIHGNCMIMDLDKFWWPALHQRFVEMVIETGYHWRFRWNEQGVMAMLWQMFVPEGHFQFDNLPVDYFHPRKVWGQCPSA